MKTVEMMQDWVESGCKKEYIATKNINRGHPLIARNNGCGVLMQDFTSIGINRNVRKFEVLYLCSSNINTEWNELEMKYNTEEAITKYKNGDRMISLDTSNAMTDPLALDEFKSVWIEYRQ